MKIRIPYVVITAVEGRTVNDYCFIDTTSRRTLAQFVYDQTCAKVIHTEQKVHTVDMAYTEVGPETVFTEVCRASGANKAWDGLTEKFIDIPAESDGETHA